VIKCRLVLVTGASIGTHDIGGRAGFGSVDRTPDAALYPEGWEGRCIAAIIATMAGGLYNVDEWRARIEELPPAAHFAMGYYRRWFHTLERNLTLHDVLTTAEIDARAQALARGEADPAPDREDPEQLAMIEALLRDGAPLVRPASAPPRFAVGDRVRTRRIVVERPGVQHTRLPGYLQERVGVVERVHPPMTLPDANVHGVDRVDHLYAVAFSASDLWPDAEPGVRVSGDLFETYLDPEEG
jgi:nitrile hydratase